MEENSSKKIVNFLNTLTQKDKSFYKGLFKESKRHGKGFYYGFDVFCEIEYKNGIRHNKWKIKNLHNKNVWFETYDNGNIITN